MSNDQKIMDKFVEQSQEILVLKDLNRRMMIAIEKLKQKIQELEAKIEKV